MQQTSHGRGKQIRPAVKRRGSTAVCCLVVYMEWRVPRGASMGGELVAAMIANFPQTFVE